MREGRPSLMAETCGVLTNLYSAWEGMTKHFEPYCPFERNNNLPSSFFGLQMNNFCDELQREQSKKGISSLGLTKREYPLLPSRSE